MEIEEKKDETIGGVKIEYFENYFGKRKDYFIPKLIALENGKKYSFNYGAFFFGIFWVLYRRLYVHSLIIFLIVMIESMIEMWLLDYYRYDRDLEISMRVIWLLIYGIVLGYLGNYFYLKSSKKKIEQISLSQEEESFKMRKLKKLGSGNWILVLSFLLIVILFVAFGQK